MGIISFLAEYIFEILIIISIFHFDSPFKPIGIFLTLSSIHTFRDAYLSVFYNMVEFVDFKTLKFKSRLEYVLTRTFARVVNPINIGYTAIMAYFLNKEFGRFYYFLSRPVIFWVCFYLIVAILTLFLEILGNVYSYRQVEEDEKLDKFVLVMEFLYFLSAMIAIGFRAREILINTSLIQAVFAFLMISKCLYDKSWKLRNYFIYIISAKILMFMLIFIVMGIVLLCCEFYGGNFRDMIFYSTISIGIITSFVYSYFSSIFYKNLKNN